MTVYSLAGFSARRRPPQRQQQPERVLLNRQQQQQGSTEFQQGHSADGHERPAAALRAPRELKSYVRESSVNIDA
ncbi:MAG: hypothetical protein V4505_07730 [Pseudomonadota bacterium]